MFAVFFPQWATNWATNGENGMELSVRHLINRSGIYYFRYRLPGKKLEIKVSLRTGDLKKAVAASKLASERLRSLIDSCDGYFRFCLQYGRPAKRYTY